MSYAFFEIEWWTPEADGREVLRSAMRACGYRIIPDGCHVYTPDVLNYRPDGQGECSLWFSVQIRDGDAVVSSNRYRKCVDAIRFAGWRVKTAGLLPDDMARAEQRQFFDWLYADDDEAAAS
jgi:hypothetical protein